MAPKKQLTRAELAAYRALARAAARLRRAQEHARGRKDEKNNRKEAR
jgi:hypothetical protein